MKNYYHLLFLIFLSLTMSGQTNNEKLADKMFAKRAYVKAASMYEQVKPNQHVLQNLGDCYFNNSLMKDAARVYGQLFVSYKESISPEYYFRYAHALMGIKDFQKADAIMADYLKTTVDTPKFIAYLRNNVLHNYTIQLAAEGTGNGDFGLSFYGSKVAFASSRNQGKRIFSWNEKPYLDLYSGNISQEGQLSNIEPFPQTINSDTHESSATFSADGKTMYFNRTNSKQVKTGDEKFASVKLFKAELIDGNWANVKELSFSSDSYSTQHPMLSNDGKKLYFSSDMPGSLGSLDIYMVDVNQDGTFGLPINLGSEVNTIHREQFPYISDDGSILYFTSDGHQGMGGLDIFMSSFQNGVFTKPMNLGTTINGSSDDFSFVVNEKENKGYLSSNVNGSDQIFSFSRADNEFRSIVQGEVKDQNTKALLPGTTVSLFDEYGKLIEQTLVSSQAIYVFKTEPNKKYRIEAQKESYILYREEFQAKEEGKLNYTIELFRDSKDDAKKIIAKSEDGKVQIVLENIYFDFDKWDIQPDAALILDALYGILVENPKIQIELGAHTDSRATEEYNQVLSEKRAASTLEYLVQKGIERNRLQSKGYGETIPLVLCEEALCTEEQHAANRRCEFIILK